ncbi:MAG: 30S ribosome-binding factor RbfA [Chloroflexi bacterium]|nr:30S ribosome-binding factor RbfA [Chloroflexota bacterium]
MARRHRRLNELLRAEISDLLLRQVKDPRLSGIVTITEVDISPDLKQAKVFVSVLGSEEEKVKVFQSLNAAAKFFRHQLGERLTLRFIPELTFHHDNSLEQGARVLELLRRVTSEEDSQTGER